MIYKKYLVCVLVLVATSAISAQNFKFGKVSKEELSEKVYAKDTSAAAAILFRSEKIKFNFSQANGFKVITYVHGRLKIYNKEGFKYATVREYLFQNGGTKEVVSGVKAITYNLEGGNIIKHKMDKSGRFSTRLNKYRNEEKFTLPNIKEGSVIEYSYEIKSPIYYSMGEIKFQYDIPIKRIEVAVSTPEYFNFKPNVKGYLQLNPEYSSKISEINFLDKREDRIKESAFVKSKLNHEVTTTDYVMVDVPALKDEPYVNDMDNYRSAVNYELLYVHYPGTVRESYTTTWEKVVK